jgi:integrase/recombinase XerC
MPASFASFIQQFLDYLTYQKRYSQHTITSYQTDLVDFFDFMSLNYVELSLPDIKPTLVRSWLASLKEKNIASKSINRKISSLKSLFKYHLRNGTITVSPMTTIVSLKVSKRLPSFVEQKDTGRLFKHLEFPETWKDKTDQLLLKIFYQTGMRLSELVNLKEGQVDISNSNIKVIGKGNKERIIPVNTELINDIASYLKEKKANIEIAAEQYILTNSKGKKLYPKYVYNAVRSYLAIATTITKKSPHVLRHTFATHLVNNGADINAVKELLGHSSLAATQVYTHNSIEKLKNIHKKAHPKS